MAKRIRFSILAAVVATLAIGIFASAKKAATHSDNAVLATGQGINSVNARTDYDDDQNYSHCFYQNPKSTLYFDVVTDPSINSIHFHLLNIQDPKNPKEAEPASDWPVTHGQATITIGPDHPSHLGPGPYVADLAPSTAPKASKAAEKPSGAGVYFYGTWLHDQTKECPIVK